jgi:molecular chaperone Hsp33
MIQRLPDPGGLDAEAKEEGWRAAMALMAGGSRRELLDPALSPQQLLLRLFHEGGVRVYRARRISDSCRCSRQRVVGMLQGLPRGDLEALKVDGVLVVTCEFCNRRYTVADDDLATPDVPAPS